MKRFFLFFVCTVVFFPAMADVQPLVIESVKTFSLQSPMTYQWEKEKPVVADASLVVVRADENIVRPSEGFEAVIFIEDRVAERARVLDKNRMVMIVPGLVSTSSLIWKGPKALPEDIDTAQRQALYEKAKVDHLAGQSLWDKIIGNFIGASGNAPAMPAAKIAGAAELYKATEAVR